MGRPKKVKTSVMISLDEIEVLSNRLGYKRHQDMLDDLAMGTIHRTADPEAPPTISMEAEGLGMPEELAQTRAEEIPLKEKRTSWAADCEAAEAADRAAAAKSAPDAARVTEVAAKDVPAIPPTEMPKGTESIEAAEIGDVKEVSEAKAVKSWTDVVKGNRAAGSGLSLEFIPQDEVVKISDEDWEEGARLWNFPVVARIVNAKPSYTEIAKWVDVNWKAFCPTITQLKPGIFVFDFLQEEHRSDVIQRNWTFYHKYAMVLRLWDADKRFEESSLNTTHVWVQLPGLHSRLWTPKNLSSIVSFIGTPVTSDKMTAQRTRLDFARVLVEVKTGADLPAEIPIDGPKGRMMQEVIYEWKIKKCSKCGRLGHEVDQCRDKTADKSKSKEQVATTRKDAVAAAELIVPVVHSTANVSIPIIEKQRECPLPNHDNVQASTSTTTGNRSKLDAINQGTMGIEAGIGVDPPTKVKNSPKGGPTRGNTQVLPNG